jgi:hypothetical protein
MGRRRFKLRLLVPLLGLLVIVGVVGALVLPQFFTPSPTQTTWQAITAGITDSGVPKQTALEAFAYVYKVNIPGVTVPSGFDGGDVPTSGTGAMDWVQANWSQLTPDQQAVIDTYTTPGPGDQTIQIGPDATAAASPASSGAAAQPEFQLMVARKAGPIGAKKAPDAPITLAQAMSNELYADIARIGPKLGMPVLSPGSSFSPNISLDLSMSLKDGGNALMTTYAEVSAKLKLYTPCHVTVWKNGWENENVTSSGGVSPTLHVLLTHEVVHCYQDVVWGSNIVKNNIPAWIKEGTAMWLAADDTGIAEPFMTGMWNDYFFSQVSLTKRTYDAYGYFALLAHNGRDLWSLMLAAWQAAAAAASSDPSTAFIGVLQGDAADIRNNWAESYLRQTDWGDPWIAYGFGLPDATEVNQHPAQAQPSPGWTGSLDGRANIVLNVNATSGEVVTITTDGLASVHDNSNNSSVAFQTQRFCTAAEGCVCPPGTLLAGQNMASQQMTIPFVAAFNAPAGGSHYAIAADKLDELCQKPATPQPQQSVQPQPSSPKGPCGSNCGGSNGDPHLTTINKAHYEFQAAGEFTLLRSTDGKTEIQARQEPWGNISSVATNTAIAAKVGSHRVGVYVVAGKLQASVDGKVVDLTSPMDLGGGGQISTYTKGFEIDFPDGTKMWTLAVGQWGINVQISPSAALSASGTGLLAAAAPGGLGLPALPNGTQLPTATDRHSFHNIVYGQYADAWRVTDSTTLFDYGPGQSTATYTNRNYPAESADISLADLTADQLAKGNAACAAITDSSLRDECVFDVGVTSDAGFADSYKATQSFYNSGQTSNASSSPAAPTPAASASISGALKVIAGTNLGGFALGPNDMAYVSEGVSPTQVTLVQVDLKAGQIVQQVDLPVAIHQASVPASMEVHVAGGAVWLPGITADGKSCTVTRLDASTLATQATIAIPCTNLGPEIVSDGSAVWFIDTTKYDLGTLKGAVLTRIDPVTNAPGGSVALPFIDGIRMDSEGALFYQDASVANLGYYRLTTGASALDSLGTFKSQASAAGTGLWVASDDGKSAQYFTAAGAPAATLPIPGTLVGGDATGAFVQILGKDTLGTTSVEQLWRYPIDGSAPTLLSNSPTVGGHNFNYAITPGPIASSDGVLTVWAVLTSDSKTPVVFLQWVPTS